MMDARLLHFARGAVLLTAAAAVVVRPLAARLSESDWKDRIGREVQSRLQGIVPRKIKTRGRPKVARWEDIDKTLARIEEDLDLEGLLREIRSSLPLNDQRDSTLFFEETDQILARFAVPYGRLFKLKDLSTLFPLTNNVLRLSRDENLVDLEVFDKTGFSLGRYVGKYLFEKSGGLSSGGTGYRLTYFQYRDNRGKIRQSGTVNLLDTYSVRWADLKDRPVFMPTVRLSTK